MATLSKSAIVERHVRMKIAEGAWPCGGKLPSNEIIQSELGVSRTVIREAMSILASEGLIVRKQKAGTFVSSQTTECSIAILAPMQVLTSNSGYFYQAIASGTQGLIKASGYRPVLTIGHGPTTQDFCESIHLFDEPVAKQIIGVICIGGIGALKAKIEDSGMCYVEIEAPNSLHATNSVGLSYEQLIKMGVEYFKAHGHFDLAIMYPDSPYNEKEEPSDVRRKKMKYWVQDCGIELKEDRFLAVPFENGRAGAYDVFKQFWAMSDRPKAIFITDDIMCEIATRAILDLGIKVPQELSIITHSNAGKEIPFPVSLTSLQFNLDEITKAVWYMLQNMINTGKKEQPFVRIYPKIVEGESVSYA